MKKVLIALAAAATIAAGTLTAPTQADARCYGCGVGAGIIAGTAAGLIVGSAIANSYPHYAVAPGYVAYAGYAAPAPVGCPGGYWGRRATAFDAYGNPIRWSRPRFFCP
jgi:hypothetical protein